ncbi:hypothetical protein BKA63DRAFT_567276 [Paraphoma chrysanthemicola]|nr:hypothetical protein BKA63DRAFT_567276 [Paraphoma chrysanthemicola]
MSCLEKMLICLSLILPLVMAGGFSNSCDECIMHYDLVCKCYTGKGVYEYLISTLNLNPIIGNKRGVLTYPGAGYLDTCQDQEIKVNKDKRIFLLAWCWIDDPLWENERKTSIELSMVDTGIKDNPSYLITSLDLNKTIGNTNGVLTYPSSGYRKTCPFHDLNIKKDGSMLFLKARCYIKKTHPGAEMEESRVDLTHIITNRNGVLVVD